MILTGFMPPDWENTASGILPIVNQFFKSACEQHPARRWEYRQALSAYSERYDPQSRTTTGLDIGGGGSPLVSMLNDMDCHIHVIDPVETRSCGFGCDLETYLKTNPPQVDALFSISVLEHVPDDEAFLENCIKLLKPGGLLFLTMDAVGIEAERDTYHFNWMRQRIYTPSKIHAMISYLEFLGMELFGKSDFTYHGPTVYDYSFFSLAMLKKEGKGVANVAA